MGNRAWTSHFFCSLYIYRISSFVCRICDSDWWSPHSTLVRTHTKEHICESCSPHIGSSRVIYTNMHGVGERHWKWMLCRDDGLGRGERERVSNSISIHAAVPFNTNTHTHIHIYIFACGLRFTFLEICLNIFSRSAELCVCVFVNTLHTLGLCWLPAQTYLPFILYALYLLLQARIIKNWQINDRRHSPRIERLCNMCVTYRHRQRLGCRMSNIYPQIQTSKHISPIYMYIHSSKGQHANNGTSKDVGSATTWVEILWRRSLRSCHVFGIAEQYIDIVMWAICGWQKAMTMWVRVCVYEWGWTINAWGACITH